MSMTFDLTDFEKGLKKLVKEVEPTATARGLFKAGNQLLRVAIGEKKYAPFHVKDPEDPKDKLGGALRASARTQGGDGTLREQTGGVAPPGFKAIEEKDSTALNVGFNIVYAHRWHELTAAEDEKIKWTLPGAGHKYLESKMATYADGLAKIVGESLKRELGGK